MIVAESIGDLHDLGASPSVGLSISITWAAGASGNIGQHLLLATRQARAVLLRSFRRGK